MNDAISYATEASNTFKNSLQYLIEEQNKQKLASEQALSQKYQSLFDTINSQKTNIEQDYATNARQTYIDKMLASRDINQLMNRMQLNTQGVAIDQQNINNANYGKNITTLQNAKQSSLNDLQTKLLETQGSYNSDFATLQSNFANNNMELNKYITESSQDVYNQAFSNYTNNKQYQDSLLQQAWENTFNEKQLNESIRSTNLSYSNNSGFTDNTSTDNTGAVDNFGNIQSTVNKSNYYFANSKQPRYVNNVELVRSGQKVQDVFESLPKGVNSGQSIWTANGKYYMWSNSDNNYIDVTSYMLQYLKQSKSTKSTVNTSNANVSYYNPNTNLKSNASYYNPIK